MSEIITCLFCNEILEREYDDNETLWAISDIGIIDVCETCYHNKVNRKNNLDIALERDFD